MIKKPIIIQLASGLEPRPVAVLVQVASQYNSKIYVEDGDRKVNAKLLAGEEGGGSESMITPSISKPDKGKQKSAVLTRIRRSDRYSECISGNH